MILALLGLAVSAVLGIWIARGVSRPVLQLAEGAREIAAGNYQHRVELKQEDELGSLAASFNQMSEGLAERDRVRDLLGKVVSPEVAAELLRKEVALGGEERQVTVLFSDLRNFTSMSEALSPQEMLGILNHYFTRMGAIVEKHGGVVDKYMGDALMALFGAPLGNPDDADRAMKTALEMTEALDDLNRQWHKRGLPTIGVGIGINTDVVVAGNMGSETRLNYTVIGDGVNLASRLEGLTKTPRVPNAHHYQRFDIGQGQGAISHAASRRSCRERKAKTDGDFCAPRPGMILDRMTLWVSFPSGS